MLGWLFCKKKKIIEKALLLKRTKEIVYEKQEFEVGVTEVEFTSSDTTKFIQSIYGDVHQQVMEGSDENENGYRRLLEPCVDKPNVYSSKTKAKNLMFNSCIGKDTITNDEINPTESHTDKVVHKKILSTKEFSKMFNVAIVKDKVCI